MKKLFVVFVITAIYVLPLSVMAQRRGAVQTKAGKYDATVIYDAINDYKQTNFEGSNYKSYDAHYITKLHIAFQSTQPVKAIRHDGTTSIVDPRDPQTTGTFNYEHSGEEHHVSNDGYSLRYDSKEEANYAGVISKGGFVAAEFPDTGDAMLNGQASGGGIGSGSFRRTINREEYVQPAGGSAMQAKRTNAAPEISTECEDGTNTGPLIMSGRLDAAQPAEKACAVELPVSLGGFNVSTKELTQEEMDKDEGTWAGAKFVGSFASGKYSLTLAKTIKPQTWNTEIQNGINIYSETLSFGLTLTVGGATAEMRPPDDTSTAAMLGEMLLLDDRLRFRAR